MFTFVSHSLPFLLALRPIRRISIGRIVVTLSPRFTPWGITHRTTDIGADQMVGRMEFHHINCLCFLSHLCKRYVLYLKLLVKLLFFFPLMVLFTIAYVSYLALEEGSPFYLNNLCSFYFIGYSTFTHAIHRISFDLFSWSY